MRLTRLRIKEVLAVFALRRLPFVTNPLLHTLGTPSVEALGTASSIFTADPSVVIRRLYPTVEQIEIDALSEEFSEVEEALRRRWETVDRRFPALWSVEDGTSRLLYVLARLSKPKLALEIGVADGTSSFVICEALRRNGSGVLHSIDVNPAAGSLMTNDWGSSWVLHIHDPAHTQTELAHLLYSVGAVSYFFHDAAHSYRGQFEDYAAVAAHLASGAPFISDDVHASYAFLDWCLRIHVKPTLLFDKRKVTGTFMVPASSAFRT
jgi:predicted O-methyltransferase YrrM